jgi:glutamyl/glutaminyl-tRNA synthetase
MPAAGWRTRFAPAPTGALHLGHLVNALFVWGMARAFGGRVLLRIEDHDRGRCRPAHEQGILDDLDWLGLVPDEWPPDSYRAMRDGHPGRQGNQEARYAAALQQLEQRGLVYPCRCSRADIARGAPVVEGAEPRYPGTCRHAAVPPQETLARRVVLGDGEEWVDDLRVGGAHQHPASQCGDLLARDRLGNWTYQFAVVVDDLAHGIDVVIRGEDLYPSCGRQQRLGALLGRDAPPRWLHHPLLYRPDGHKLSKALGDTALAARRAIGASPAQLLGEAAHAVGLWPTGTPLPVAALPALFA